VIDGTVIRSGDYIASWTGTAQARINAGSYGASGITATLTGGTNATIEFGTGTVSLVKLEFGTVATTFPMRSLAEELARCEYRLPSIRSASASTVGIGVITGTGTGVITTRLKSTPRAIPTGISLVGGAVTDLTVTTGVTSAAATGLAFLSANDGVVSMLVTWTGGPTSLGALIFLNTSATQTSILFTGAEPT
jgi:hypothetical protein